jgi:hypothetical protein
MLKFLDIFVPSSKKQKLQGVETWIVSWTRRTGEFSSDTKKCYQAFASLEDAKKLKKALEDAHDLIGNTSGTYVSIEKQQSGLSN